ncbi:phytanoyl-CoA dioxygenase family protein [Variovorax boronicumulans]|uniref:phytanoyl-CoA dioxygenase family protein n=1 Tax=Variovorax boronicumulans TaxID=436515 RepID=UPI003398FD12
MPIDQDSFHLQGYARLSRAIEPVLIDSLCAAIDAIQSRVPRMSEAERARLVFEKDLPAHRRDDVQAQAVGDAIFILGEPCAFDPMFDALLDHPAIRDAARTLLASDALTVHFMNVTIKHPRFGRSIGWHRDFPNDYICPASSGFVRLMLCLDGMEEAMGATRFLPGSHRLSDAEALREKSEGTPPRPSDDEGMALECTAGDLVAIHPKVLHGGGINRSDRMRRNVVLQIGLASEPLVTTEREGVTGRLLS